MHGRHGISRVIADEDGSVTASIACRCSRTMISTVQLPTRRTVIVVVGSLSNCAEGGWKEAGRRSTSRTPATTLQNRCKIGVGLCESIRYTLNDHTSNSPFSQSWRQMLRSSLRPHANPSPCLAVYVSLCLHDPH